MALLSVVSATILPTKTASCEEPKSSKAPVLELKAEPPKSKGDMDNKDKDNDKRTNKEDKGSDGDKINLPGPLHSIPIPKLPTIPTISMDDIMEKVHSLGEKIGDEIKGRVPTLADYFTAIDAFRTELQLGDGSLYQTIVNNMQDSSKNPEIQLDATVRSVQQTRYYRDAEVETLK
jgi:phospholipase A2